MPSNSKRFRPIGGGRIAIPSAKPEPVVLMGGNGQPGTHALSGSARPSVPLDAMIERPMPKGVVAFRMPQIPATAEKAALVQGGAVKPRGVKAPKRNTIKM